MRSLPYNVVIRSLNETDVPEILTWTRDEHLRAFIMNAEDHELSDHISNRLDYELSVTSPYWVVAEDWQKRKPIGAAWLVSVSRTHGTAFLNAYVAPDYRRSTIGRFLSASCILQGFRKFALRKINIFVHEANIASSSGLLEWSNIAGATLEGSYRAERYYHGAFWNLYRFAIHRKQEAQLRSILQE